MARMEPLPAKKWPPEMHEALTAMTPPAPRYRLRSEGRPTGGNILGTLAHHPALAKAFFTLNSHLLLCTSLTERQRELVIMRVAALRKSDYEWAQHVFMARDTGLTDLEIAGISWGPDALFWNEVDANLLRAVDDLVRDGVIADDTWTVLTVHLDARQILDVIFTAGAYSTVASMLRSLAIDLDDDLRKGLAELIRSSEETEG